MEKLRSLDGARSVTCQVEVDGTPVTVELMPDGTLLMDRRTFHLDVSEIQGLPLYSLLLDGTSYEVVVEEKGDTYYALVQGRLHRIRVGDGPKLRPARSIAAPPGGKTVICAPLCGLVVDVLVTIGQAVETEQAIMILESMKMENEIRSPCSGTIREVRAQAGSMVREGDVLAVVG